jgi:hypothetical protein
MDTDKYNNEAMEKKSCLNCKHYKMSDEEDRGRLSTDFCGKKGQSLPAAAFSFEDVCCGGTTSCFNLGAFSVLEETAEKCEYYEPAIDSKKKIPR